MRPVSNQLLEMGPGFSSSSPLRMGTVLHSVLCRLLALLWSMTASYTQMLAQSPPSPAPHMTRPVYFTEISVYNPSYPSLVVNLIQALISHLNYCNSPQTGVSPLALLPDLTSTLPRLSSFQMRTWLHSSLCTIYTLWWFPVEFSTKPKCLGHLIPTHPSNSSPTVLIIHTRNLGWSHTDHDFECLCRLFLHASHTRWSLGCEYPILLYLPDSVFLQNAAHQRLSSVQSFSWMSQALFALSFFFTVAQFLEVL